MPPTIAAPVLGFHSPRHEHNGRDFVSPTREESLELAVEPEVQGKLCEALEGDLAEAPGTFDG